MTETTSKGTTAYTRDNDGAAIAGRGPGGVTSYYILDSLGSIIGLFDKTGAFAGGYSYTPYGELRGNSNNAATNANALRYTAGYWDASANLYRLGARYYDPTTARFTQYDPSGQEANPYSYAACNPIDNSDPTGLNCANAIVGLALAIIDVVGVVVGFVALATNPAFLAAGIAATAVLRTLTTRGTALLLGEAAGIYGIGSEIDAVRSEC